MTDLEQTDPNAIEAVLATAKGTMVITFLPDRAPLHVNNFLSLAKEGFYDGTAFHRVVRNFMVQGGCPNTKLASDGTAGQGQPGTGRPDGHDGLRAEFHDLEHRRGVVSMARGRDPNSAGSQFFIVQGEHAQHLDGKYTAFAVVEEGLDVLDEIAAVECDFGPNGEQSQPKERIELQSVQLRPRQQRQIEGAPAEQEDAAAGKDAAGKDAAGKDAAGKEAASGAVAPAADNGSQPSNESDDGPVEEASGAPPVGGDDETRSNEQAAVQE